MQSVIVLSTLTPWDASAESDPPSRIGGDAQAVRVAAGEVPLFDAPGRGAKRRGTLVQGATALFHAHMKASGCAGDWVLVGASAWACNVSGAFVPRARGDQSADPSSAIEFARVGAQGALGYKSIETLAEQLPDAELQPGFFVGLVEERSFHGEPYGRTTHGVWIAKRDVVAVVPSDFRGVRLAAGPGSSIVHGVARTDRLGSRLSGGSPHVTTQVPELAISHGWVFVERATPRRSPNGSPGSARLGRLAHVRVLQLIRHADRRAWYLTDAGWLSDRELRVPSVVPPPAEIGHEERWIDVDRQSQTLVAYTGETPVFATLVSTGRGLDQGPLATPVGVHRIWVKLSSTDMDNLQEQADQTDMSHVAEPYAVEAVPFVAFFFHGYGLHATYWHDAFGTPRSHGCVNLSLHDAAWVFEFVGPKLSPGWQAVHPDRYDSGTLVRVR